MATTTTKTNKPILPRGVDNRPVDSYNRAELYSGKALDFDGVNDFISTGTQTAFDMKSIAFHFIGVIDSSTNGFVMHPNDAQYNKGVMIGHYTSTLTDECLSIGDGTNFTTTKETFDDGIHFAVFSWDATNSKYKIFVNGIELTTENNGADSALISGVTSPVFGKRASLNDFYLDGGLSNIRLFNTALTATQVAELYNNPEKIVPTGVSDSALKLWLPMQEGAGTTAINGAPDALGSEEVTNGDFDTDSDWNKAAGWTISGGKANANTTGSYINLYQNGVFTIGKTYKVSFDITDYTSGDVRITEAGYDISGLINAVGSYSFVFTASYSSLYIQGLNSFVGSIDNVSVKEIQNVGTISGATWTHGVGAPVAQTSVIDWNKVTLDLTNEVLVPQGLTSGRDLLGNLFENVRKQGALNLDGKSWAEVHDNASLDFGTGSFTLEAWVKADFLSQGSLVNTILSLGGDLTGSDNSALVSTSSAFSFWIGGVNKFTPAYVSESWNHIVGVRSGSSVIFYFNGAQVATGSSSSSITNSQEKQIGRDETTIRYYPNQIAQPRIYNRALTASEVLNNYNATKTLYI